MSIELNTASGQRGQRAAARSETVGSHVVDWLLHLQQAAALLPEWPGHFVYTLNDAITTEECMMRLLGLPALPLWSALLLGLFQAPRAHATGA